MEKTWNILFKHKSKEETIKENTDLLKIKEVSTLKKKSSGRQSQEGDRKSSASPHLGYSQMLVGDLQQTG